MRMLRVAICARFEYSVGPAKTLFKEPCVRGDNVGIIEWRWRAVIWEPTLSVRIEGGYCWPCPAVVEDVRVIQRCLFD